MLLRAQPTCPLCRGALTTADLLEAPAETEEGGAGGAAQGRPTGTSSKVGDEGKERCETESFVRGREGGGTMGRNDNSLSPFCIRGPISPHLIPYHTIRYLASPLLQPFLCIMDGVGWGREGAGAGEDKWGWELSFAGHHFLCRGVRDEDMLALCHGGTNGPVTN